MKLPVVLFIFRRVDTLAAIAERIKKYNPPIIYVYGDGPRHSAEVADVEGAREAVRRLFEGFNVVYDFSENNRGVKENIGGGALKTFEKEKNAIFLEDDNLPSESFFGYCEELIHFHKNNDDVIWICGTNYLGAKYKDSDQSYFYTKNLLPCGWASWSHKFTKYYDINLTSLNDSAMEVVKNNYKHKNLMRQEVQSIYQTFLRIKDNSASASWDRQMNYALRFHNKLGIMPKVNLIKNIGADRFSVHGGTSTDKEMTSRFCEIKNENLNFPLNHPVLQRIDYDIENEVSNIILQPLKIRIMREIARILKRILFLDPNASLLEFLRKP